jgi:RNA polymerase sigma-70 factor (ECF subfamily)
VQTDDPQLAALLRAAIAGDEASYARFLGSVAQLVRGLVRRKIGAASMEIEDIVQETLLAIHSKRHTWRPDAPVLPWVRAIARYKVVDTFRRRGHRVEVDIADFA